MKNRSYGFLADDKISHEGEIFDYIRELHDYLWRFVRAAKPGASGNLEGWLDQTLSDLESRLIPAQAYRATVEHIKEGVLLMGIYNYSARQLADEIKNLLEGLEVIFSQPN